MITLISVTVVMIALSWQITVLSLLMLPLFLVPAKFVGRRLSALTREQMNHNAEMSTTMTERFNVSGALLVKLFGTPAIEQQGFEDKAARVRARISDDSMPPAGFTPRLTTEERQVVTRWVDLGAPIEERSDRADGVLVRARLPERELPRYAPFLIAGEDEPAAEAHEA